MRTTLNINEQVPEQAQTLSGIKGKSAVAHAALKTLIAVEAGRQLARLGGSDRVARAGRRRRSWRNI